MIFRKILEILTYFDDFHENFLLVLWIFLKSLLGKITRFHEKVLVCDTRFLTSITGKMSKKSKTIKKMQNE